MLVVEFLIFSNNWYILALPTQQVTMCADQDLEFKPVRVHDWIIISYYYRFYFFEIK